MRPNNNSAGTYRAAAVVSILGIGSGWRVGTLGDVARQARNQIKCHLPAPSLPAKLQGASQNMRPDIIREGVPAIGHSSGAE